MVFPPLVKCFLIISQPNRAKAGKNWFDSDDDGDDERSMKMSETTLTSLHEEEGIVKEGHVKECQSPTFIVNVTRQVVVETSPR